MRRAVILTLLLTLAAPRAVLAQAYQGSACKASGANPLKGLKVGAVLAGLDDSGNGTYSDWASSTLLPTGKAPACKDCPPEAEDDLKERVAFQHAWTCTYSAERANDGKPETAWCEGAKGNGVGEVLIARVRKGEPVELWAGLGKSAKLHAANARPRKVNVYVLEAGSMAAHQAGMGYGQVRVVAKGEVELKDVNGYQELKLPAYTPSPDAPATFVAIEVVSVYPGKQYEDLCVSELH